MTHIVPKVIEFQEVPLTDTFWKWTAEADAMYMQLLEQDLMASLSAEITRIMDMKVIEELNEFLDDIKEETTFVPYVPVKSVEPSVELRFRMGDDGMLHSYVHSNEKAVDGKEMLVDAFLKR